METGRCLPADGDVVGTDLVCAKIAGSGSGGGLVGLDLLGDTLSGEGRLGGYTDSVARVRMKAGQDVVRPGGSDGSWGLLDILTHASADQLVGDLVAGDLSIGIDGWPPRDLEGVGSDGKDPQVRSGTGSRILGLGCFCPRPLGLSGGIGSLHFECPPGEGVGLQDDGVLATGQVLEPLVLGGTVLDDVPETVTVPLALMERSPRQTDLGGPEGGDLQIGWGSSRRLAVRLGLYRHHGGGVGSAAVMVLGDHSDLVDVSLGQFPEVDRVGSLPPGEGDRLSVFPPLTLLGWLPLQYVHLNQISDTFLRLPRYYWLSLSVGHVGADD